MTFTLGFFSGMFFIILCALVYSYRTRHMRKIEADFQAEKDELLMKSLPVYSQVRKIFKKTDIEPQKIASLMFIAKLIEDNLEEEISKKPATSKTQ